MDANLQNIAILLVVLLFSMSIHEMMHAFAADWLGDDTARMQGRLTINPLAHIDPVFTVALPLLLLLSHAGVLFGAAKPVQVNFNRLRHGELGGAIVGAVGPLTNLLIAGIAAILFNHFQPVNGTLAYSIFFITIMLNVGLFIFNSIPWPPLDGSRVLYAVAPRPLQEFMESIESMGMMGLVIFVFILYYLSTSGGGNGPIGELIIRLVHFLAPNLT